MSAPSPVLPAPQSSTYESSGSSGPRVPEARRDGWLDAGWGLLIALLLLSLLVISASPGRADRGFIYVDF